MSSFRTIGGIGALVAGAMLALAAAVASPPHPVAEAPVAQRACDGASREAIVAETDERTPAVLAAVSDQAAPSVEALANEAPTAAATTDRTTLVVVDAATGTPVSSFDVATWDRGRPDIPFYTCWHPGGVTSRNVIAHDVASPVRLATPPQLVWWVGASGYAWQDVVCPAEGDAVVRLERGGDLAITVIGGEVPAGAMFLVRERETRPAGVGDVDWHRRHRIGSLGRFFDPCAIATPPRTVLDGLRPGPCTVVLVRCSAHGRVAIGEVDAVVPPGGLAEVTLALHEGAVAPPLVRVRGTLTVAAGWDDVTHLWLTPQGPTAAWATPVELELDTMPRNELGALVWDAGELRCGTWCASLPCDFEQALELRAPGEHHFVLPPPCNVRVRFADLDTGQPVSSENGNVSNRRETRAPDGTVELRATPGEEDLFAPEGYAPIEPIDVRPGDNDLVIGVRRKFGAKVVLVDGDFVFPASHATLHGNDGGEVWSWAEYGDDGLAIGPREPGAYELRVPQLTGFEPIAPRQVDCVVGQWTEVRVPLRKLPSSPR